MTEQHPETVRSDYQEFAYEAFTRSVTRVSQHLRDVADRIDRTAKDVQPSTVILPDAPYTAAAQRIAHDFLWGMANANLDGVITTAGEADAARRSSR